MRAIGTELKIQHTQFPAKGEPRDQFPELMWDKPSPDVQDYVLLVEDADLPLPFAALHGLYFGILGDQTKITLAETTQADLEVKDKIAKDVNPKGPIKAGKNLLGNAYEGPRTPFGHGPHRYFYQLIALKEKVDQSKLSKLATKDELDKEMEGKVLGWGMWIGVYERKWK